MKMQPWRLLLPVLVILYAGIVVAPIFAPYDPMTVHFEAVLTRPGSQYVLGTDQSGRDVLSRLLYGGRRTLLITSGAVLIAVTTGTLAGITAGFYGGVIDRSIGVLLNALLAIPGLMTAMLVLTMTGRGTGQTALAVGIVQIAPLAQVIRTQARLIRTSEAVTGAYAIGASNRYILRYYVLTGCLPLIATYSSLISGYCLLNVGALGFLGLAGEPGIPEWGIMLAEGREVLREAPWVGAAPGIAITLTLLAVNWFSDQINQSGA